MQKWPAFRENGDLPVGIYRATLGEVLERFGTATLQRRLVGQRLGRVYALAARTGQVTRFAVFSSFVTATPHPNDIDIFLIMAGTFDVHQVQDETAIIFDHQAAQNIERQRVLDSPARRNRWRRRGLGPLANQAISNTTRHS